MPEMNYKRKISAYIITLILIFSLIGCSNTKNSTSPVSTASDETKTAENNNTKIGTTENSGLIQTVGVGKIVTIILYENITTGYGWHYSIENSDLIKLDSESTSDSGTTNTYDSKPVIVGTGSQHTWNFKGIKSGTTKITFKYYRSWEGEKSADKTVEYTFKITE